jgi:hypothetical protein
MERRSMEAKDMMILGGEFGSKVVRMQSNIIFTIAGILDLIGQVVAANPLQGVGNSPA